MNDRKRIVIDVDGVLAKKDGGSYEHRDVDEVVLDRLRRYKEQDFDIILYTSRNMRTYNGRIGSINANTAPILLDWLEEHDIPYDEIYFGKPWCGYEGFYVDDRAIRPSEFISKDFDELRELVAQKQ